MLKRFFDIIISLLGIIFLTPLFVLITILIKIDSLGSAFFMQERIGKNGIKFQIYKFRSMKVSQKSDNSNITIGHDSRITKIGHTLRKYKIDELPQLFNVLAGNMSIVGPRPEVAEYVNYYSAKNKAIIFSVRPGITDFASIRFRNESEILGKSTNPQYDYINKILPRKLRYCRFYVKEQSLMVDLKIICMTIQAILKI